MKQLESGLVSKKLSKNESTLLTQIQYDVTNWLQVTIVNSLLQSDNYDSIDEVVSEFNCLLNLYDVARSREFTQNENNLFLSIHDKFLALLLSDDELVNNLLEVE